MNRFYLLLSRLVILIVALGFPYEAFSVGVNPITDVVLYDNVSVGGLNYCIHIDQDGDLYAGVIGVNKVSYEPFNYYYSIPSTIECKIEVFDEAENEFYYETFVVEVKSINEKAFYGGYNITSVSIPSTIEYIGDYAFGSTGLYSLELPNSILHIGKQAFSFIEQLSKVDIPNSVIFIGDEAFEGSGMESVSIPASVQYIGYMAFIPSSDFPNLNSITVDENNPFYDSREDCNCIIRTADNVLISGSNNSFIPDGVTKIEKYAFTNCKELASITIPSSVAYIGEGAFSNCSSIESVIIPNSVLTIEGWCFDNCSSLKNVQLGNSLKFIGHDAFSYTSIQEIIIPKSVTEISGSLFNYAPYLRRIEVEAGNRYYDSRDNCNAIIKTSSNYLLDGCANIIPNSVKVIGPVAFAGRECLSEVVIPNSVDTIEYLAFSQSHATKVRIGNSVKFIGASCFRACYYLQSVVIGASVDYIGDYSFYDCAYLNKVVCLAAAPPYIWNACRNYKGKLYVLNEVLDIYRDHPFWGYNFPTILSIDELRGDIDEDGKISINDVTELIDDFFLIASVEGAYNDNFVADVDGDGWVTIADVVALVDLLFNQGIEETEDQ